MFGNLTGWHALILLAVVLLVFGAAKLPALARSVGQSVKILQKEVRDKPATSGEDTSVANRDNGAVESTDASARHA
ncbi:twin-arginine translocase TatA/TatE family subunit [Leifsonia shinshuensis]|uniref:Sec-independent protein translocase protein TatA n=1 Tax=Leifsonia shinshuensis TaxID=150026 RepID=A0A7G6YAC1_9MICO|nr:twin-arginine translocase TatA/TatE family subunit [Leifsonia shinshuensis]QNE35436.1 Sec-independent protein translocase TatA [Leifsonia shinshuensis]